MWVNLKGDSMLAFDSLTLDQSVSIISTIATVSAVFVAIIMPFWLQRRRTNKMVLMLARELQKMSETISVLHRNFNPQSGSTATVKKINEQTGNNFSLEVVAFAAFSAWRDGLSLEMWKAFRYEIDPEPYKCFLEAYKIIEYIIQEKASPAQDAIKFLMAKDLLNDFNKKYAELSKVCKYYSTV